MWSLARHGLTQGAVGTFLTCPEKFRLAIQYGLTTKWDAWNTPIEFGNVYHEVMADTLRIVSKFPGNLRKPDVLIDVSEELFATYQARKEQEIIANSINAEENLGAARMDIAQAQILLRHYFRLWATDFGDFEWVALEKEFKVPTTICVDEQDTFFPLRGKMDGIYLANNGRHWLFETKTKGRIDDQVMIDRLPYEFQVQLYLKALAIEQKTVPAGVLYNLIRRPLLRQKQSEDLDEFLYRIDLDVGIRPEWYFLRYEYAFSEQEMNRWWEEFVTLLQQFVRWDRGEYHYRNSNACGTNFGACEFVPICSRNDFSRYSQNRRVFRELEMADVYVKPAPHPYGADAPTPQDASGVEAAIGYPAGDVAGGEATADTEGTINPA